MHQLQDRKDTAIFCGKINSRNVSATPTFICHAFLCGALLFHLISTAAISRYDYYCLVCLVLPPHTRPSDHLVCVPFRPVETLIQRLHNIIPKNRGSPLTAHTNDHACRGFSPIHTSVLSGEYWCDTRVIK